MITEYYQIKLPAALVAFVVEKYRKTNTHRHHMLHASSYCKEPNPDDARVSRHFS